MSGCEGKSKVSFEFNLPMNSSGQLMWPVLWLRERDQRDSQLGLMLLPPAGLALPQLQTKSDRGRKSLSIFRTYSNGLSVDSPCLLVSFMSHFLGTEFRIPLFFLSRLPVGLTWQVACVTTGLMGCLPHTSRQLRHFH